MDVDSSPGWSHQHHNRKRTHDQMSSRRSQSPQAQVRNHHAAPSSSENTSSHQLHLQLPAPRLERFVGDGIDGRRPISASASAPAPVIDLTDDGENTISHSPEPRSLNRSHVTRLLQRQEHMEQQQRRTRGNSEAAAQRAQGRGGQQPPRMPRFPREIIDLIDLSEGDDGSSGTSARSRRQQTPPEAVRVGRHLPPLNLSPVDVDNYGLWAGDRAAPANDDLEFVSSRPVPQPQAGTAYNSALWGTPPWAGVNSGRPASAGHRTRTIDRPEIAEVLTRERVMANPNMRRLLGRFNAAVQAVEDNDVEIIALEPHVLPMMNMNYNAVGFDLGADARPPSPKYSPPPPAPEGFTRSPQEDDVLVCPNCGDELCTGESDIKRQAWLLKGCGHVYCGDCTHHRSSGKHKSKEMATNRPLPRPFRQCVVDGCTRKAGKSALIQLWF
ncbi:hypothetical protein BJ546DRAFT_314700 [Cryomyces antarcticus]